MALERQNDIKAVLKEKKSMSIRELADYLQVSDMTIRRELNKMEAAGTIIREFGSVSLNESGIIEMAPSIRAENLPAEKKRIAEKAAEYVTDGDTIAVDTGSTISRFAKVINGKKITMVTSNITAGMNAAVGEVQVYLAGGKLNLEFKHTISDSCNNLFSQMNFKFAFTSAAGVSIKGGVSEYTESGSLTKRVMCENSEKVVLLVDHSKFSKNAPFKAFPLSEVDLIITDEMPENEIVEYCSEHGIAIIIA